MRIKYLAQGHTAASRFKPPHRLPPPPPTPTSCNVLDMLVVVVVVVVVLGLLACHSKVIFFSPVGSLVPSQSEL